jgi:hypothetical protein
MRIVIPSISIFENFFLFVFYYIELYIIDILYNGSIIRLVEFSLFSFTSPLINADDSPN